MKEEKEKEGEEKEGNEKEKEKEGKEKRNKERKGKGLYLAVCYILKKNQRKVKVVGLLPGRKFVLSSGAYST